MTTTARVIPWRDFNVTLAQLCGIDLDERQVTEIKVVAKHDHPAVITVTEYAKPPAFTDAELRQITRSYTLVPIEETP